MTTSSLAATLAILATFGLMLIALAMFFTRAHTRMDEVVTGVVNGVPVPLRYRWLLLAYDYTAYWMTCVVILGVFGTGYLGAAKVADDSSIATLTYLCGATCLWGALAVVVFVAAWIVYMISVLRQAGSE
jgi:hypothetical protein